MKFSITRTSLQGWSNRMEQPHRDAIEDGEGWFIEADSIEELLKYADPLIVIHDFGPGNIPSLEIYDDYREQSPLG